MHQYKGFPINNIKAVAKVKELKIIYIYRYEGVDYEIETPKTEMNKGVADGEIVHVRLGVMPFPEEVITPERIIDDE